MTSDTDALASSSRPSSVHELIRGRAEKVRDKLEGMDDEAKARTEEEWRRTLTPEQFRVLREHGTERAGTSPLNHEKRAGTFRCGGCGQPLFVSGHQVRERHRLAQLLGARRRSGRDNR